MKRKQKINNKQSSSLLSYRPCTLTAVLPSCARRRDKHCLYRKTTSEKSTRVVNWSGMNPSFAKAKAHGLADDTSPSLRLLLYQTAFSRYSVCHASTIPTYLMPLTFLCIVTSNLRLTSLSSNRLQMRSPPNLRIEH